MIEMTGKIARVVYKSPDTGWCVLRMDCDGKKISVVGIIPEAQEGISLKVQGKWKKDKNYGKQLAVEKSTMVLTETEDGIVSYLSSGFITGVGPILAQRIYDKFKEDTYNVIENFPEQLGTVKGVTNKKVQAIALSWKETKIHRELHEMLHASGITKIMCVKIKDALGFDAVQAIHDDPYVLFRKVDNVGFLKADHYAKSINVPHNDPRRIRACIEYVLKTSSKSTGHCYLTYEQLIPEILGLLEDVALDDILDNINKMIKDPKSFLRYRKIGDVHAFYFKNIYDVEVMLADIVKNLNSRNMPLKYEGAFQKETAKIEEASNGVIQFSMEQKEALLKLLDSSFGILTGGPGTGKTTITQALVNTYNSLGLNILLAAPTGRAGQRMVEITELPASTIHRLLGSKGGKFAFNATRKLDCDVLIIDECSMIDIGLFFCLLRAVSNKTRVILIGDKDQIQPVGVGDVFRNLVDSPFITTAKLTKVFRQAYDSGIVRFAHGLKDKELIYAQFDEPGENDCIFYPQKKIQGEEIDHIVEIAKKYQDANEEFQILSPMRRGMFGVENLNETLQLHLNPPMDNKNEIENRGRIIREGDRVIQTVNNYDLEVFNGDLGFVESINTKDKKIVVNYLGQKVTYSKEEISELAHSYAITIHKSQGSEFQNVAIMMFKSFYTMLSMNLLYTGATRAKKNLHIFGEYSALKICAENTHVAPRQTYFPQLLLQDSKLNELDKASNE